MYKARLADVSLPGKEILYRTVETVNCEYCIGYETDRYMHHNNGWVMGYNTTHSQGSGLTLIKNGKTWEIVSVIDGTLIAYFKYKKIGIYMLEYITSIYDFRPIVKGEMHKSEMPEHIGFILNIIRENWGSSNNSITEIFNYLDYFYAVSDIVDECERAIA